MRAMPSTTENSEWLRKWTNRGVSGDVVIKGLYRVSGRYRGMAAQAFSRRLTETGKGVRKVCA